MASDLENLLAEIFKAQGAHDALRLARRAAETVEMDKRDGKIYDLRADHTEAEVATRFGISCVRVRQIVKEQTLLRRGLLKVG